MDIKPSDIRESDEFRYQDSSMLTPGDSKTELPIPSESQSCDLLFDSIGPSGFKIQEVKDVDIMYDVKDSPRVDHDGQETPVIGTEEYTLPNVMCLLTEVLPKIGHLMRPLDSDCLSEKISKICKEKKVKFTDPDFGPTDTSLVGPLDDTVSYSETGSLSWARATDIFGTSDLAVFTVLDATDIIPGKLATNYLVQAMACLATQRPALLKRLISQSKVNDEGIYEVWLCVRGMWTKVVLDDYFPITQDEDTVSFAFSRSFEDELWVSLIEKAFAKINGSYSALENGNISDALRTLSGSPVHEVDVKSEDLWMHIKRALENKSVCCVTILDSSEDFTEYAYSILEAGILADIKGDSHKLLKLKCHNRDPKIPNSKIFSETAWHQEIREFLNADHHKNGIFYTTLPDILPHLASFHHLQPTLTPPHTHILTHTDTHTHTLYTYTVTQTHTYTHTVDHGHMPYATSEAYTRVTVCRVYGDGETVEYVGGVWQRCASVAYTCELTPGVYAMYVDVYMPADADGVQRNVVGVSGEGIKGFRESLVPRSRWIVAEISAWKQFPNKEGWSKAKNHSICQDNNTIRVREEILDLSNSHGVILRRWCSQKSDFALHRVFKVTDSSAGCDVFTEHSYQGIHHMHISYDNYAIELIKLTCDNTGIVDLRYENIRLSLTNHTTRANAILTAISEVYEEQAYDIDEGCPKATVSEIVN